MRARLFEALLASAAGVLAATVVAALRLVLPGGPRPQLADVGQTLAMIALAFLPVLFCVAVPFAFRLGRMLERRPLLYYAGFVVGGVLAWLGARWMYGGPRFGAWREWLALGVMALVALPVTAWALRARLRVSWGAEAYPPSPMRGPSSMVSAILCVAAVTLGWHYAKWAALSIVDGDFALPAKMTFRTVDWVGMALAGAVGVALVGVVIRGHRRDSGWTVGRTAVACLLAMAAAPFTQYLAEFLLLPAVHEQRALPDPQVRWSVPLAARQLLHLLPAFAMLFLFVHPPSAMVRRRA